MLEISIWDGPRRDTPGQQQCLHTTCRAVKWGSFGMKHNIITPPSAAACNAHTRQNGSTIQCQILILSSACGTRDQDLLNFGDHVPNCRFLVLFIANSKTNQHGLRWISSPTFQRQPCSYNFCSELLFNSVPHCQSEGHCQSVFTYIPATDCQFSVCPLSVISRHCMWAHSALFGLQAPYREIAAP